jgi:hypothetical protein
MSDISMWADPAFDDVLAALETNFDAHPNDSNNGMDVVHHHHYYHQQQQQDECCAASSSDDSESESLELTSSPNLTDTSSLQNSNNKKQVPKPDYAVDHLDLSILSEVIRSDHVATQNMFPVQVLTEFKKKYYRFDNKMLQCFPGCSRFADVREARMLGLDHRSGRAQAWCSNSVQASILLPIHVNSSSIQVVGRFLAATPDAGVLPESDAPLLQIGMTVGSLPANNSVRGNISEEGQMDSTGKRQVSVVLHPDEAWFVNLTLPRHRRNATCAAHKVPLFVFELLVFVQTGASSFQVCARSVSAPFEIASIRTLIREVLAFRQGNANTVQQQAPEKQPEEPTPVVQDKKAKLARRLPLNYSSAVHRIRLAEASRKEMESKKVEMVIEVVPNTQISRPVMEEAQIPDTPSWMTQPFELPDINVDFNTSSISNITWEIDDEDLIPC